MDPLRRSVTSETTLKLLEAVELFQEMDREVPAQVVSTFLYIASHNECHSIALMEDLDMTGASVSRNTDWLSKNHRLNKPGLDLIVKERDPSDMRRQILKLTAKGSDIHNKILTILYGDTKPHARDHDMAAGC